MSENNQYPSLIEQGKNLSKFTLDIVKHLNKTRGKNLFANDKLYDDRLNVCKSCDKYDSEQKRCTECGCFIETKARIILDSCPLNKWTESLDDWERAFEEMVTEIEENNTET